MVEFFTIRPATSPEDIAVARRLFRAYADSLPIDLSYQQFDAECASLPGCYAPPAGALLLAFATNEQAVGCVALKPLAEPGICEAKRLYVVPEARGHGLAEALMQHLFTVADKCGYQEMRLDTLPSMQAAQALYRQLGFREIAPYYDTPIEGTLFMGCVIASSDKRRA